MGSLKEGFAPFFVVCNTKEELTTCWKHLRKTYSDFQNRDIDSRVFTEPVMIYCKRWVIRGVSRGNVRLLSIDSLEYLKNEVGAIQMDVEDILKGDWK